MSRIPTPAQPKVPIPWWGWLAFVLNMAVAFFAPPNRVLAFGILGVGAAVTCLQVARSGVIPADRRRMSVIAITLVAWVAAFLLGTRP